MEKLPQKTWTGKLSQITDFTFGYTYQQSTISEPSFQSSLGSTSLAELPTYVLIGGSQLDVEIDNESIPLNRKKP